MLFDTPAYDLILMILWRVQIYSVYSIIYRETQNIWLNIQANGMREVWLHFFGKNWIVKKRIIWNSCPF